MAQLKVKVEKRKGFGDSKERDVCIEGRPRRVYDINDIAHQVALGSGVNERQFKAAVGCRQVDAMIVFLKGTWCIVERFSAPSFRK